MVGMAGVLGCIAPEQHSHLVWTEAAVVGSARLVFNDTRS